MAVVQPARLSLRLIGVPGAMLDGRAVTLGSRKALALLAVLALDGAAPRARIAALLWPDQDDASARRNLRREVFRLRNAGIPIDDAEAHAIGLAEQPTCDVHETGSSGGTLLDGFDGLAGEEYAAWLDAWRARLAQRGRRDAADVAAAHESRGEWRLAIDVHLAALDADATNESAAQHALRLYARLAERDAALALFARLESQLHRQLGLAPLPQTRELLQQVIAAAVSPAAPAPQPATVAATERHTRESARADSRLPARAPFSGRDSERQRVHEAWQQGRAVYLSGPPGIGKSRLAAECAADIGAALLVTCRADDLQLAYSSAVRVLRALLDSSPDLELPGWVTRELTRLLPELAPPAAERDAADPIGDEARMRLFEAYAQAWLQLADENFSVIVIDDWQLADEASLRLWSFVDARAIAVTHAVSPLRRLVAYRSGELPVASLAHVRRQVESQQATLIEIEGLAVDGVQSLVQRLAGQSGALRFAQRLHDATAGSPLFILETIRHLFDRQLLSVDPAGGWQTPFDAITSDYAELPVPASARDTLLARVHGLGPEAARLLQAASLAGASFDLALLAGTAALDDVASVSVLERAQASQILRTGDDGSYRFAHDLYRQCLADSVSPARRSLLHGRLARNLAAAGAEATRIARHFELAQLGREAAPWFVHAGADAARVYDFDAALAHYGHAIELGLDAGEAYAVRNRRVLLLHRQHRTDDQLRELALMTELAQASGDAAAPYDLALKRAATQLNSGQIAEALALARWVAAGTPPPALAVRARYVAGVGLMYLGDEQGAMCELEAALAAAPAMVPEWEPMICAFLCHIAVSAGALDLAQGYCERGLRAAGVLGKPLARGDVLNAGYRIAEAAGDRALAIARLEEANELGLGAGDVTLRINYLFNLVVVLLNGGDAAAANARRAEVVALTVGKTDPKSRFIEQLLEGRLAAHRGELAAAWRALGGAFGAAVSSSEMMMQRSALVARAHLAADCEEPRLLEDALSRLAGIGPHPDNRIVLVEETFRARLELLRGEAGAAADRLRRALDPAASRCADPDWQENLELAQVTLGAALTACGDAGAAREASHRVRFSTRLQAMATQVALSSGDGNAAATAQSLFDEGRLAPLESARLRLSLASCLALARDAGAKTACDAARRELDALATMLAGDEPDIARLRAALSALSPR